MDETKGIPTIGRVTFTVHLIVALLSDCRFSSCPLRSDRGSVIRPLHQNLK